MSVFGRKADGVDGSRSRHLGAKMVVVINNHEQKEPSTQDIIEGPQKGPNLAKPGHWIELPRPFFYCNVVKFGRDHYVTQGCLGNIELLFLVCFCSMDFSRTTKLGIITEPRGLLAGVDQAVHFKMPRFSQDRALAICHLPINHVMYFPKNREVLQGRRSILRHNPDGPRQR